MLHRHRPREAEWLADGCSAIWQVLEPKCSDYDRILSTELLARCLQEMLQRTVLWEEGPKDYTLCMLQMIASKKRCKKCHEENLSISSSLKLYLVVELYIAASFIQRTVTGYQLCARNRNWQALGWGSRGQKHTEGPALTEHIFSECGTPSINICWCTLPGICTFTWMSNV